jgi:hypothetical protein
MAYFTLPFNGHSALDAFPSLRDPNASRPASAASAAARVQDLHQMQEEQRAVRLILAHAQAVISTSKSFLGRYPTVTQAPEADREQWAFYWAASHGNPSLLQTLQKNLADAREEEQVSPEELAQLEHLEELHGRGGAHYDWLQTKALAEEWLGAKLGGSKLTRRHPKLTRLVEAFDRLRHFKDTNFQETIAQQKQEHALQQSEFKLSQSPAAVIVRRVRDALERYVVQFTSDDAAANILLAKLQEPPSSKPLLVEAIRIARKGNAPTEDEQQEIDRLKLPI